MKILVAGASGQVASCLERRAAVRQLSNFVCLGRPGLDLANHEATTAAALAQNPSIIVNAAAYTDVERAEEDTDAAFAVNAGGAGALAVAARKLEVPLIHISTDYVYSGSKAEAYVETDATGPINAYGRSKLAGEHAIRDIHSNSIILRTSWIYSQFGKNFVTTMTRLMQSRDKLDVVDDQTGCPTSAWDVAESIIHICVAKGQGNSNTGIYHFAGTGSVSWFGFAREIRDLLAKHGDRLANLNPIDTASYPSKAARPKNSVLDTAKIKRDFGIVAPPWKASLASCMAEIRKSAT